MTLSTDIAIIGPIDPEFLFSTTLVAVCLAANEPERIATASVERREASVSRDHSSISTTCGQGLAAWTFVRYRADGSPYRAEDEYETDDFELEDGEIADTWFIGPACQALIDIDTAYSFRASDGAGCGTLHARVIRLVHASLPEGCSLKWKNEFTGDWFDGLDGLDGLEDGGVAATNWFTNDVMPVISAHVAAGGPRAAIES